MLNTGGSELNLVILISEAVVITLSIALIITSLMMEHRLRSRFDDIYKDYGFKLKMIFIIQVLSLIIGATFQVLNIYCDTWNNFWLANEVR